MDTEQKIEEFVVGTMPGNTQLLSALSESDPELSQEISYLMGGVECYKDINQRTTFPFAISNEDASFDIKEIIKRILKYLAGLADDVFDGSMLGALAVDGVLNRAERVQLDGRSKRRNHSKSDFLISTRIANLSVRYKPISDPQQLLQQLKIFGTVVRSVLTYLTYSVFTSFETLINFDPIEDDIETLARSLQASAPSVMVGDAKFTNNGFNIVSPQLLGCQKVVITNRRPEGSALDQILGCMMSLDTAEPDVRALPDVIKYDKFGLSLEQTVVREVISIASMIININTLNRRTIRRNRAKLITGRLDYLNKRIEQEQLNEEQIVAIRNYIRVLEVYAGWISSPYVALIALAQRNMTAVLNVCEGNAN